MPDRRAPLPLGIGRLFEPIYRAEVARRNRRWDAGVGVERLPMPVISIGNLSVGGTGKTPMVVHVVQTLLDSGVRPCIAMRGYMRRSANSPGPASGGGVRSDEARMYADRFPGVPVVAQPDRISGVRALQRRGERIDCVVLDDGFQHRRLARDLDVVLIDASCSPFVDRLLPAGWLREPVDSLRRARAVVITHSEAVDASALAAIARSIEGITGRKPAAITSHRWSGLTVYTIDHVGSRAASRQEPVTWLLGRRVAALCAIGNPRAFFEAARRAGAEVAVELPLPDHDPYHPRTIRQIGEAAERSNAEAIVTTEKDWAKLRDVNRAGWPKSLVVTRLELAFDSGRSDLDSLILHAAQRRDESAGSPGSSSSSPSAAVP